MPLLVVWPRQTVSFFPNPGASMWPSSSSMRPWSTAHRHVDLDTTLDRFHAWVGECGWYWLSAIYCPMLIFMQSHLWCRSNDMSFHLQGPCWQFDPGELFHCRFVVCDISIPAVVHSIFYNFDTASRTLLPYSITVVWQSTLPAAPCVHITRGWIHTGFPRIYAITTIL